MWKRLWKNVILALCVLALVLQPVMSFATWQTPDYTATFTTKLSFIQYVSNTSFLMTDVVLDLNDNTNTSFQNAVTLIANAFNKNKWEIVYILSGSDLYGFDMSSCYFGASDSQILKRSGQTETYYSMEVGVDLSPESGSINRTSFNKSNGNLYLDFSNSFTVQFFNDNSEYYNLQYNYSGNGYSDNSAWLQDIISFLAFNLHGYVHSANSGQGAIVNTNWVNIGQFLTYDYLCKTNPNSQTVAVTLLDGTTSTVTNYLYNNNYSSQLSSISSTLNTISSRVNTTNTRLNTVNSSINTQMTAVNNKLDAAFPANQAAINDFIAEDLMDDTGGNGLTINRIAQSKSDLNDGLDTFKLDTSGSQYSNPFSALGNADWSFWSQTTLYNLGSGYSYSFGEGSLMSDEDVFTENQNDLLNLLGW